jgi:hypothetical protein
MALKTQHREILFVRIAGVFVNMMNLDGLTGLTANTTRAIRSEQHLCRAFRWNLISSLRTILEPASHYAYATILK